MTRLLLILSILCAPCGSAFAVDREAFTFTNYDLNVRVEPEQQRLTVRGKIALRNDSDSPQKDVVLQISSSLDWKSIQLKGKPVQFLSHTYASDVDHTGALSEAVVTLPQPIAPHASVDLEIGYEGTIPRDTTRLTRIGVPDAPAKHSDWDEISKSFIAVRGAGYVAWYPVAMDSANLSEANSVDETVGRWKVREARSSMTLRFQSSSDLPVFCSVAQLPSPANGQLSFHTDAIGLGIPTFVIADYQKLAVKQPEIQYLPQQFDAANEYAQVASNIDPPISTKNGPPPLRVLGLPDTEASAFVTDGILLTPLKSPMGNNGVLDLVYAEAWQHATSPRAWIQDGLAHYAQVAFLEAVQSRSAAVDYLKVHQQALVEAEKQGSPGKETGNSLINAPDDLYLQTKAMFVWSMLKDMMGRSLGDALHGYEGADDKDATYVQRLVEKTVHRDLQWFFDDWVYRDRGLPEFRIVSVYPRPIVDAGYMVTVEIENTGLAGAEVPVTLLSPAGDVSKRLMVPAQSKASIRIETGTMPTGAVVNDGSVPENDMTNDTYKIETPN